MAKTWSEKMNPQNVPKTVTLKGDAAKKWGICGRNANLNCTMYISCPKEVSEFMAKIPKGKLTTTNEIRDSLAKKHEANITCPLTTGIFAWIVANYANEQKKNIPYWRTLKVGGELNSKYPGGIAEQQKLLEREGHKVIQKGKKMIVENFEKSLIKI